MASPSSPVQEPLVLEAKHQAWRRTDLYSGREEEDGAETGNVPHIRHLR